MPTFIRSDFTTTDTTAPKVQRLYIGDTFNRADSPPGTPETGGTAWTYPGFSYTIASNALQSGDTTLTSVKPADCHIDPAVADVTIKTKLLSYGASQAGLVFRKSGAGPTAFVYYAGSAGHILARRTDLDAFTVIPLNGTAVSFVAGETLKVEMVGNRIICSVNGLVTHDVTDATSYGTGVGLFVRNSTVAVPARWDEFYCTSY